MSNNFMRNRQARMFAEALAAKQIDRTTDLEMARTEANSVVRTINALWAKPAKTQGEWDALESAQARLGFLLNDIDAAQALLATITPADCYPSLSDAARAVSNV